MVSPVLDCRLVSMQASVTPSFPSESTQSPAEPQRDPWRQERALNWKDITNADQARLALYGRCAATGRPWVLPTEPESFRMPEGYDVIDDETLWICQRLLGLGSFVERVARWSEVRRQNRLERIVA